MGALGTRYKHWDSGDSEDGFGVRMIDVRVFIYGVEVTEHLMQSYNRQRVLRDAEGTCTFTLDNNYDKFVVRSENQSWSKDWQENSYFADTWNSSALALGKIGNDRFIGDGLAGDGGYFMYHENAKRDLYNKKKTANFNFKKSYLSTEGYDYKDTYTLLVGELVIHRMDHVRVFILDPLLDPAEVESGDVKSLRWVPDYTGFVDVVERTTDQETGASTIQISCVDIRNMMKRKRVLLNPDISVAVNPDPQSNIAGVFANIVKHTTNGVATTNVFANMSFDKTIAYLLCNVREDAGNIKDLDTYGGIPSMSHFESAGHFRDQGDYIKRRREGLQNAANSSSGLGSFALGHVYQFPAEPGHDSDKQTILSSWYSLTTFGVNRTWYTDDEVTTIGSGTYAGGPYSSFSGFVHFLMPTGGLNFNNVIERVLFDSLGVEREYSSIFEIIHGMCEKIDYQMQVNGMGDLLFEFPMYDFLPEHTGDDFKYVYAVGNSLQESSVNDDSESNPVTCLEVTGSYVDQTREAQVPDEKIKQLEFTVYVGSNYLATKYGPLIENYDCPHLNPIGASSPEENKVKLAVFGVIEFTKRLAAMSSMNVSAAYNPFLYPNRPLLSFYDRRVGLIESSSVTLTMRQSASSDMGLTMIRKFDENGKCALITGFENTPFSYVSPDMTMASLFSANGFGSYQDVRSKYGVEVWVADRSNVVPGTTSGLSRLAAAPVRGTPTPTKEDIAAINSLAAKHGGTPQMYASMLMNESRMSPTIANSKTQATGVFQLMPTSWDELVRNRPTLAALGSPLPNPRTGSLPRYDGGKSNSKQQWSRDFANAYPTVAEQITVFDAYLTLMEYRAAKGRASQVSKYRIDDSTKLGIAQFRPARLANFVDSGGNRDTTVMTAREQAANPGYSNAADYGPAVEQVRSAQAAAWLNAGSKPQTPPSDSIQHVQNKTSMPTNNELLKSMLGSSRSASDRTVIGGSGA